MKSVFKSETGHYSFGRIAAGLTQLIFFVVIVYSLFIDKTDWVAYGTFIEKTIHAFSIMVLSLYGINKTAYAIGLWLKRKMDNTP